MAMPGAEGLSGKLSGLAGIGYSYPAVVDGL